MPEAVVCVLILVYNAERNIAEVVESIFAQTFEDFDFVIVDHGSTDGSLAILECYAKRDSRIRLVSRPNTVYVVAFNEGLSLAHGEFIVRMDADDIAIPNRFERQIAFLCDHGEVIVVGSARAQPELAVDPDPARGV